MPHKIKSFEDAGANVRTNIVVIGGGSGIYPVLQGLKKRNNNNVTAVVSMFDSGGSTGLLRTEFGVWPLGDLRRCLVALSDENNSSLVEELFEYRFAKDSSLSGHNFGNLFLLALSGMTGSGPESIKRACEILHVKGNVVPVSLDQSNVCAILEDGSLIVGETNIDIPKHNGDLRIKSVYLEPRAHAYAGAEQAIAEADIIIIGPGDLYTSLLPNILVDGIAEALCRSHAKKIYISNIMTKWGETQHFAASDFAKEVLTYSGLTQFDYIISNKKKIGDSAKKSYAGEKKYPVHNDAPLALYAQNVILADLFIKDDLLRHDSESVASIIDTISADIAVKKSRKPVARLIVPSFAAAKKVSASPKHMINEWVSEERGSYTGGKKGTRTVIHA